MAPSSNKVVNYYKYERFPNLVLKTNQMPSGWCVVSDIDDTILNTSNWVIYQNFQHSLTRSFSIRKLLVVCRTFYKYIQMNFQYPRFWYISASPYI